MRGILIGVPSGFGFWGQLKSIAYVALIAFASKSMQSTILKNGLLSLVEALRAQVMHRLLDAEFALRESINKSARKGLSKFILSCFFFPVSVLGQLSLDFTGMCIDFLHLSLSVKDRFLSVNQAAAQFTQSPFKLCIIREILNGFRNAKCLFEGAKNSGQRSCYQGGINHHKSFTTISTSFNAPARKKEVKK